MRFANSTSLPPAKNVVIWETPFSGPQYALYCLMSKIRIKSKGRHSRHPSLKSARARGKMKALPRHQIRTIQDKHGE